MGQANELQRQQAEESGMKDGASQALLSEYSATPGLAGLQGLRTPRTPAQQDTVLQASD